MAKRAKAGRKKPGSRAALPSPNASIRELRTAQDFENALDAIFGPSEGADSYEVPATQRSALKRRRKASGTKRIAEFQTRVQFDQPRDGVEEVFFGGPMGWMDALREGSGLSKAFSEDTGVTVRVYDLDDKERIAFAWRDGADDAEVVPVPGVEILRKSAAANPEKREAGGWREANRVKRGGWRKGRQRRAKIKSR